MTEDNFQIHSAAITDRGLSEKRPQNEDSYLELNKLGLFAVADGVGGAQAGDVASQMAMEILGEAFANLQYNGDAEEMMKIAIERANSAIYQMSSDLPQLSTMATTIVALHVSGNIATIGHVGDSRLYRLDGRGNLYRETQDHSVVEEEVRAGRMTAAQAANHPSRNVISRALGAESAVEVDMKTIMFDGNTKFLLCSDGITRHITDFELRELLAASAAPAEICAKMKEICYSRGAEDNLTAVIVNAFHQSEMATPNNFAAAAPPAIDDEATVATARTAATESSPASADNGFDEIPTRALEMPASMPEQIPPATTDSVQPEQNAAYQPAPVAAFSNDDDDQYLMEENVHESPEAAAHQAAAVPTTMSFAAAATPAEAAPTVAEPARVFPSYETAEKSENGVAGKLLSGLIWLVVGAILGAAGYYLWQTMSAKPVQVTPITQMESMNPPFSTFEKLRREVDNNPEAFIRTSEQSKPKDSADFYLLGRAYLLNKNYEAARNNLIEARNKLGEYSETGNKAVLANDINKDLVIAQDKAAQTAFERELKNSGGGDAVNQSNTNQ